MVSKPLTPERATQLLAKRRAEDPILQYRMGPTFQEIARCTEPYICIKSKNQIGKTAFLQWTCAAIATGKHPHLKSFGPCNILLIVPSRAQAAEVWGKRLLKACELAGDVGKFPWIPRRLIKKVFNSVSPIGPYPGKIVLKHPDEPEKDGTTIVTILSGDPNSWKRLEGMTFDIVIRDEVAGSENLGDEITPRLVRSLTRFLSGERPWGGRAMWAATETKFNDEWQAFKTRAKDGVQYHAIFEPSPIEAAAYVSMEARSAMRLSMSDKSYQIRGEGNLDASDLVQVFGKQWDDGRHMLETDYRLTETDNIYIGYDPGVEHPTGIVISAVNRAKPMTLNVAKVYLHKQESLEYDVECLRSYLLGRRIAAFVYDYKMKETHKHARSMLAVLIDLLTKYDLMPLGGFVKSDKRHWRGISLMRTYLDPDPFNRGVDPLLYLSPSMDSGGPLLRDQIIGYQGRESQNFSGSGGVVKEKDDALDAMRYVIAMQPSWSIDYRCGPVTMEAPRPLQDRAHQILSAHELTPDERRRSMSKARTKHLVQSQFDWRYQARAAGVRV